MTHFSPIHLVWEIYGLKPLSDSLKRFVKTQLKVMQNIKVVIQSIILNRYQNFDLSFGHSGGACYNFEKGGA